jgi:acyl-coenzyme A thioesterase PaaI-like protein
VSNVVYPPASHVLRDLSFSIEVVSPVHFRGRLELDDGASFGSVATVVDVLAGALCGATIAPDWMATSSLTLRASVPAPPAVLVLDGRPLRAGPRSVVVEVVIAAAHGEPLGDAIVTFARLERREDNLVIDDMAPPGTVIEFERLQAPDVRPFHDRVGLVVLDAAGGECEISLTDDVRNSFGAINGGVLAGVIEGAALALAGGGERALAAAGTVDDVAVHHLGQGRVGPLRTSARRVSDDGRRTVVRVEVRDTGLVDDDPAGRLVAVGHTGVVNGGARV